MSVFLLVLLVAGSLGALSWALLSEEETKS